MNVFFSKDALQLPDTLDRTYEIRSCLKYSEQTATYLLREKSSGRPFLLKTATDPVCGELLVNEKNILDFIHQSADDILFLLTVILFNRAAYLGPHT